MLDNAASDNAKRYTPPSQRNRVLNRRKSGSGDRGERTNYSYGNDAEKNQASHPRNFPVGHRESVISNVRNQQTKSNIITLEGCCSSDAARLLKERWRAAINSCNDPSVDLSERPVLYSGASGSTWGHFKPPHQVMDFWAELHRCIHSGNVNVVPTAVDHSGF